MNRECLDRDIIDVIGLCDLDSIDLEAFSQWTQISIPENLILPDQKPDIEQINSIKIRVEILRKKVITTPSSDGPNEEGKILTGRKLIVEGVLCQTITYTAAVPEQSLHSAEFAVPFSAFIVLEDPATDLRANFQVNSCIEDVFITDFCPRQIFKNVTLLLQAVPAPLEDCPCEC